MSEVSEPLVKEDPPAQESVEPARNDVEEDDGLDLAVAGCDAYEYCEDGFPKRSLPSTFRPPRLPQPSEVETKDLTPISVISRFLPRMDSAQEYYGRLEDVVEPELIEAVSETYRKHVDDSDPRSLTVKLGNVFKNVRRRRLKQLVFAANSLPIVDNSKVKMQGITKSKSKRAVDLWNRREDLPCDDDAVPEYSRAFNKRFKSSHPSLSSGISKTSANANAKKKRTMAAAAAAQAADPTYRARSEKGLNVFGSSIALPKDCEIVPHSKTVIENFPELTSFRKLPMNFVTDFEFAERNDTMVITKVPNDSIREWNVGERIEFFAWGSKFTFSSFAERKKRGLAMGLESNFKSTYAECNRCMEILRKHPFKKSERPEVRVTRLDFSFEVPARIRCFDSVVLGPEELLKAVQARGGYHRLQATNGWREVARDVRCKFDQHSHKTVKKVFELYFHRLVSVFRHKRGG